jgi:hypothetical protein
MCPFGHPEIGDYTGSLVSIEALKEISVILGLRGRWRQMRIDTQRPVHQIYAFLNLLEPRLRTTHTVAKGLLLPPQDRIRKQTIVKGLPQQPLFGLLPLYRSDESRGNGLGKSHELLVQKGGSGL